MVECPKRPVSVPVGGVPVEIAFKELPEDYGESTPSENRMTIDTSIPSEAEFDRTLIHEMMHVAIHRCGWERVLGDSTEEAMCIVAEMALDGYKAAKAAVAGRVAKDK